MRQAFISMSNTFTELSIFLARVNKKCAAFMLKATHFHLSKAILLTTNFPIKHI